MSKRETTQDVLNVAAAAAPLLSAVPVAAALPALLAGGIGLFDDAFRAHRRRRVERLWTEFVLQIGSVTAEEAITEGALSSEDEAFQERIYEVLNALWSAADEAVIPHLAYLAARYQAEGNRVDPFYKGLARLLQDSTAGELETLRRLLDGAESALRGTDGGLFAIIIPMADGTSTVKFAAQNSRGERREAHTSNFSSNARTVLRRLLNQHLVDEASAIGGVSPVMIDADRLRRLQHFIVRPLTQS